MDSEQEYEKSHSEATVDVGKPDLPNLAIVPRTLDGASCSTSSPSSILSEEDFFQIHTTELGKPAIVLGETPSNCMQPPIQAGETQLEAGQDSFNEHEMKDVGLEQSNGPAALAGGLPIGGNPFSSYDAHSNAPRANDFVTAGGNQSPKTQLMYRSDVADPNRIPASVFARNKSGTPMEWSVTSNESLFSIPTKSGDLTGLFSNYLDICPPLSPGVGTSQGKGPVGSGLQQVVEAPNDEAMNDVPEAAAEESDEKEKPTTIDTIPHSDSTSQRSDAGSVNSHHSFAFPILTHEERNRSCKVVAEQHQPEQPQKQPLPQAEPEEDEPPKVESVATTRKSWLSCFFCSFCC